MNKLFTLIFIGLLWLCGAVTICMGADAQAVKKADVQLRMGFYAPALSYVNSTDLQVSLEYWAQEIASKHNVVKSTLVSIYQDIREMAKDFNQNELDMVVAPPLEMATYFARDNMRLGFMPVERDTRPNAVLVLTRKDKNIQSADDLSHKRLLLSKNDYLAEIVLDTFTLKNLHQPYQDVFNSVKLLEQNNLLVLNLFFDQADVSVVYESIYRNMIELNPQIADKLSILYRYPVKVRNLSFFRVDYPYTEEMIEIATGITSPRLQQILDVFRTESVYPCTVEELEPYTLLYQEHEQLIKGQTKAPLVKRQTKTKLQRKGTD